MAVTKRTNRAPSPRSQATSFHSAPAGASAGASHADGSGCMPSSVVQAYPPLALPKTGSPSAESGGASSPHRSPCPASAGATRGGRGPAPPVGSNDSPGALTSARNRIGSSRGCEYGRPGGKTGGARAGQAPAAA